jgi:hypothetical protein
MLFAEDRHMIQALASERPEFRAEQAGLEAAPLSVARLKLWGTFRPFEPVDCAPSAAP